MGIVSYKKMKLQEMILHIEAIGTRGTFPINQLFHKNNLFY